MDYVKIYNNLILSRLTRKLDETEYYERHHIVPKCLGGADSNDNLVYLTAKEHFLAHWLLYKMYKTSELAYAWHNMCRIGVGQEKRRINSRLFEQSKKIYRKHLSENMKGEKNNFYGKHHSEKTKQILHQKHKGKVYKSKEQIDDWVEKVAKKPKSVEHRKKISRKNMVMLQNVNTLQIVRIDKNELHNYSSVEWQNPKKITPEKKYKCMYCDTITIAGNLKRWHNDNCKFKKEVA